MYGYDDEDHYAPLATDTEACREYARNVGAEQPDRAWIPTNYDSWEPNPFYAGPPVRHPEDDSDDYSRAAWEREYGPWIAADDVAYREMEDLLDRLF